MGRLVRQFAHRVENDAYGSAWATLDGAHPAPRKIMFEAHADEIGFIVKHVTKEGFLRVDRIGGSDVATARGRRLDILGDKGPSAASSATPPSICAATSSPRRRRLSRTTFTSMSAHRAPKRWPAWASASAIPRFTPTPSSKWGPGTSLAAPWITGPAASFSPQVIANLSRRPQPLDSTVYAVNAVQEEIGGHGARMIAHRLMPDVCIVLDVTHATDTPGIEHAKHGEVKLGGGPSITHGTCNHPLVVQRLLDVAKAKDIPIQHESSSRYSGTDTDVIFTTREGIPSALVSLPLRYMHSVVEMADIEDIERVVALLTAFAESLRPEDDFAVKL